MTAAEGEGDVAMEKEFNYLDESLKSYLERISVKTPAPGGGSVAAYTASLAVALLNMVLSFTLGKEKYAAYQNELEEIRKETGRMLERLTRYVEEDSEIYSLVRKYSSKEKNPALEEKYLKQSAEMHLDICDISLKIIEFAGVLAEKANRGLISDTGMAAALAVASFKSAKLNVLINLKYTGDREFAKAGIDRINVTEERVFSEGEAVWNKAAEVIGY